MNERVAELQRLLDDGYARGAGEGLGDLEDELETLLEHAETLAEGLDEAGAEHDSAYLSPEQELVDLWHRWNGIGEINALHAADLRDDEPDFPAFVRRAVHYWIRPETTDGMIEEAARDAADAYARRHRALAARRSSTRLMSSLHQSDKHAITTSAGTLQQDLRGGPPGLPQSHAVGYLDH